MTTLLVGFDSAWTPNNSGALVGVLHSDDGTFHDLGPPQIVDYPQAEGVILKWQAEQVPTATIVLLDQPTIVKNAAGQRPVENIVGSAVSLRYGGIQPANTSKEEMFGKEAPIWPFLTRFSGPADPLEPVADTRVFETYPVLAMIALSLDAARLTALRVACPSTTRSGKRPFRTRTGNTSAGWRQVHSVSADSWKSFGGSTTLPGRLRRARAIRTAWMPVYACWWRCTWPSGKTA